MIVHLQVLTRLVWARLASSWRSEDGSAVEKVILTAVFAALAIAVGAIIVAKVTAKAKSINLN